MTRRFLQWALRTPALRGARASVGRLAVAAIEAKHGTVVYFTEPERARILALFRKIRNETKTLLLEVEGMQLYEAVRAVRDIPGDIAEVGTYRGGSAKLMAEASGGAKQIHTFDTFEGLPATDALDASRFHAGQFATDADAVRAFLAPYPSVHVYEGMFPDTAGPIEGLRFSLVHLDVDLYQSTLESLRFFYPRMSPGGAIISHDYSNAEGVRQAFDEFFAGKPEPVLQLSGSQCLVLKR